MTRKYCIAINVYSIFILPAHCVVFCDALNASTLTNILNSICTDFDHTKEWSLLSEYLKEIALLTSFRDCIKLVDKRTRNGEVPAFARIITNMKRSSST
jgi:hypothetical protein